MKHGDGSISINNTGAAHVIKGNMNGVMYKGYLISLSKNWISKTTTPNTHRNNSAWSSQIPELNLLEKEDLEIVTSSLGRWSSSRNEPKLDHDAAKHELVITVDVLKLQWPTTALQQSTTFGHLWHVNNLSSYFFSINLSNKFVYASESNYRCRCTCIFV